MSILLSDIHLPALITSTLSEHAQYKSLPWNNLDQLSCLWGVFTKCKKNIRDGFRLENLSWRLWYRQSVLRKKVEPKTSEDIHFDDNVKKQLTRTRSLPDLSQWSHEKKKNVLSKSVTPTPKRLTTTMKQKFFITPPPPSPPQVMEEEEEQPLLTFTKTSFKTNNKPISLLSGMLQENDNSHRNSGLRRCQSRYYRLDQFFSVAAA